MSARFASASNQYLLNSAPSVIAFPITVAAWVRPTDVTGVDTIWSLADTGVTNHYLAFQSNSSLLRAGAAAGGSVSSATAGTDSVAANQWSFGIARFISATNRRIAALHPAGDVSQASTSTSRNPTGMDSQGIGMVVASTPINPWDGLIGEFWLTNTDIGNGIGDLDVALVRQLAYGGPFSVPHLANDIVEYRSLRHHPVSDGDNLNEVFHGKDRQVWTNVAGATTGFHPPLPYWYVKPGQKISQLVV